MIDEKKSLWLGALGVVIFALTLPMTRLAVGSTFEPLLSPWFVSFGRAALAGFLSIFYMAYVSGPKPDKEDYIPLVYAAIANVLGWPILLAVALRHVESVHASVITGILPLATAGMAAFIFRKRPSWGFWLFAFMGAAIVAGYAWMRGTSTYSLGGNMQWADILLVFAVLSASSGYAVGGRLSQKWSGEVVICWMLIILLPITATGAYFTRPTESVPVSSWGGFLYVSLFSMWLGMFIWYRALAIGNAVRVSQIQLLQPFLSIIFSIPILGEKIDATTLVFGFGVAVMVFMGKRMPIDDVRASPKLG